MSHQFCSEELLDLMPKRDVNAHKGQVGRVLLICGSLGFTGAAALCAEGALRSGGGMVYVAVPKCIYPIVATKLTEAVVLPLPDIGGRVSLFGIRVIRKYLKFADAVVIGPGLGRAYGVKAVVKFVLKRFSGPVVLDADGINVMAKHKYILRDRTFPLVLTPHEGEFRRLINIQGVRLEQAEQLASDLGAVVLLKGHNTVITDGQHTYINNTGNPGMAVGGCGDVLSGILGTLLSQGMPQLQAAACAAWVHGRAGDICADEIGLRGMLPTDILHVLPRLLK